MILYDSDRHLIEPIEIWEEYVDKDIFNQFPLHLIDEIVESPSVKGACNQIQPVLPTYAIGPFPLLFHWGSALKLASSQRNALSVEQRKKAMTAIEQLNSMDAANIQVACILPTFAMYIVNHALIPAEVSLAYADAYNRWLKFYCQTDPIRLRAVGLISRHQPQSLVMQLTKVIKNNWTSIILRPEVIAKRSLGHSDYNLFWAMAERYNIAIVIHGGTNLHASTVGSDRFHSRFALHACSHPMEAQMAFVSLLESGVFERHPQLKFGFLEAGASWVPHWLWRLDHICFPEFPTLVNDNIKMRPSAYFKRQCWVTLELGEPCLRDVINVIGHKKLLFGSDFPHPDHQQFLALDIHKQLNELTELECMDILENNARDFYETKMSAMEVEEHDKVEVQGVENDMLSTDLLEGTFDDV
ncbi:amidohydrolase family protein [uncultured Shewanella sp.]|uniref:amidohydrolase family protein n=1 Tax=uncultured Shewanella sp. TaxID=173975 RepID=UPI00262B9F03|nr:amidohydrolase family protein [uncultured Shewanella sp.]